MWKYVNWDPIYLWKLMTSNIDSKINQYNNYMQQLPIEISNVNKSWINNIFNGIEQNVFGDIENEIESWTWDSDYKKEIKKYKSRLEKWDDSAVYEFMSEVMNNEDYINNAVSTSFEMDSQSNKGIIETWSTNQIDNLYKWKKFMFMWKEFSYPFDINYW